MTTQQKIESIVQKKGVKTFAYTLEDLFIFSRDELKYLCDCGLISDYSHKMMLLYK